MKKPGASKDSKRPCGIGKGSTVETGEKKTKKKKKRGIEFAMTASYESPKIEILQKKLSILLEGGSRIISETERNGGVTAGKFFRAQAARKKVLSENHE